MRFGNIELRARDDEELLEILELMFDRAELQAIMAIGAVEAGRTK